jgi:hypothetical protein
MLTVVSVPTFHLKTAPGLTRSIRRRMEKP